MIKLQTQVTLPKCKSSISFNNKILLLGSCFSDNIGTLLKDWGFEVCCNPFGTLYNPASIASAVKRLRSEEEFTRKDCVQMGSGSQKICSFSHHTSFARESEEEFLENANRKLHEAAEFYRNCDRVIITLGTAWYYRFNGDDNGLYSENQGHIVSNCLKRNASEFTRERLGVQECRELLREIVFGEVMPKDFIFTVSPIRHLADGAHGNQVSKSTLLLAVEEVLSEINNPAASRGNRIIADYFPSYEVMMDELRDYRFYGEDMCHPSQQAVRHIADTFLDWALPPSERPRLEAGIKAFRQRQHRDQNASLHSV